MNTTTVLLMTAALLFGLTAVATPAAANYADCRLPFVGGFVDRTCDATVSSTYGTTCWFIGWFCE